MISQPEILDGKKASAVPDWLNPLRFASSFSPDRQ